jgi:hypothetical protein
MIKKALVALAIIGVSATAQSEVTNSENSNKAEPIQAAAVQAADSAVVVKDKRNGKLRAATPEEHKAMMDEAKITAVRAAPEATVRKYHASGASGLRLTDEFMTQSVAVRNADGSLVHQCVEGSHVHAAVNPAAQVTKLETE